MVPAAGIVGLLGAGKGDVARERGHEPQGVAALEGARAHGQVARGADEKPLQATAVLEGVGADRGHGVAQGNPSEVGVAREGVGRDDVDLQFIAVLGGQGAVEGGGEALVGQERDGLAVHVVEHVFLAGLGKDHAGVRGACRGELGLHVRGLLLGEADDGLDGAAGKRARLKHAVLVVEEDDGVHARGALEGARLDGRGDLHEDGVRARVVHEEKVVLGVDHAARAGVLHRLVGGQTDGDAAVVGGGQARVVLLDKGVEDVVVYHDQAVVEVIGLKGGRCAVRPVDDHAVEGVGLLDLDALYARRHVQRGHRGRNGQVGGTVLGGENPVFRGGVDQVVLVHVVGAPHDEGAVRVEVEDAFGQHDVAQVPGARAVLLLAVLVDGLDAVGNVERQSLLAVSLKDGLVDVDQGLQGARLAGVLALELDEVVLQVHGVAFVKRRETPGLQHVAAGFHLVDGANGHTCLLPAPEEVGEGVVVSHVAGVAQRTLGERGPQVNRGGVVAQVRGADAQEVEICLFAPAKDGRGAVRALLAQEVGARGHGRHGHALLAPGAVLGKAVAHGHCDVARGAQLRVHVARFIGPGDHLEVGVGVELLLAAVPAVEAHLAGLGRGVAVDGAQAAEEGPGVELLALVELLLVAGLDGHGDVVVAGGLGRGGACLARLVGKDARVDAVALVGGGVGGEKPLSGEGSVGRSS